MHMLHMIHKQMPESPKGAEWMGGAYKKFFSDRLAHLLKVMPHVNIYICKYI